MKDIANQFSRAIAAQYDIPELLSCEFDEVKDAARCYCEFIPKGQLSLLVESASITISIYKDTVKGICKANIELHYNHHNSGSNGKRRSFIIFVENRFGEEKYKGFVAEEVFRVGLDLYMTHWDSIKNKTHE